MTLTQVDISKFYNKICFKGPFKRDGGGCIRVFTISLWSNDTVFLSYYFNLYRKDIFYNLNDTICFYERQVLNLESMKITSVKTNVVKICNFQHISSSKL